MINKKTAPVQIKQDAYVKGAKRTRPSPYLPPLQQLMKEESHRHRIANVYENKHPRRD